jgi:hypothetical protein
MWYTPRMAFREPSEYMTSIPQKLDWVQARAACTVGQIFVELRLAIDEDIKAANAARKPPPGTEFAASPSSDGHVTAVYRSDNTGKLVKFLRGDDEIRVENELTNESFTARLTLNDEGRCKLKIDGEDAQYEQWQIRKRALEGLFFSRT